ncbi:MAG: FAD-dependent oxidoreductase [Chroococcidiopsidaceae cyanobacterium CP_BM_RX_35]|nr:FAD-dependent oxidoreductase [Chroococcidiopsidaceae cyanobacterium CP_BM_RX_35]
MKQIEAIVAKVDDLQDGEMQQVSVGDIDVLLARVDGKFHAVGAYCSHYQAPLAQGVLSGNRVVCPWHNACFNVATGDRQEPPGLDALTRYQVRVEGENIVVCLPEEAQGLRTPSMAQHAPEADGRIFAILGAGAAGAHAAETLRETGYQGRVVMVTSEDQLPYDRTWLSKDYFIDQVSREQVPLRSSDFYKDYDIEVLLNKQAVHVDAGAKLITFKDGDTLNYDALLLATGGKPRQLDVPGKDLQNVFTLRSFEDTNRILAAAHKDARAVVIGSSFIGMEAAAGLTQQGLKVTVVASSLPFKKILGEEIGRVFQQVHEEQGVSFRLGRKVTQLAGNGKVEAVILDNGEKLVADLVVVGIGVQPATEFLEGVELHPEDQSVPVDEYLCAAPGLYAAGDIACYPDWRTGKATRIEHWRLAAQHGQVAAHNMAGQTVKFMGLPVFWTMQFKFPLRYVGHAEQWDEIIFDGKPEEREFIAFYIKDNQVLAAATSQRDTETAAISELMRLNQMPTPEALRNDSVDLVKLVKLAKR